MTNLLLDPDDHSNQRRGTESGNFIKYHVKISNFCHRRAAKTQ